MQTQLVRTEIVNHEADPRIELAKRAESLLGYSHLRKHLKVAGDLAAALQLLEIRPFEPELVNAYKNEMVGAHQRSMDLEMVRMGIYHFAAWHITPINEYHEPVPEFVLRKAIQIKELCPDVSLFIDHLVVRYRTVDPFLVAELDHERFYVEVWDEPTFEREL